MRSLRFACCFFVLAGCYRSEVPAPCNLAASGRSLTDFRAEAVDILFVMDDSRSMAPYQQALRLEFPRVVRGLVTGDHDGNPATPSYPPVSSLRVGFVTTDMGEMGVGTFPDDATDGACIHFSPDRYGDDGRLVSRAVGADSPSNPTGLNCDFNGDGVPDSLAPGAVPAFLTFDAPPITPPASDVDAFVNRASCFALVGSSGCGSEMPLESMLKALTPSTSPVRFFSLPGDGREFGRGDDPLSNAGWLRPDSVLAVVVLSDEDDCSSHDHHIYDWGAAAPFADPGNPAPGDPNSPYAQSFQAAANTRCVRFSNALLDVSRFVDGLLAMRSDPTRVVFTAITGVPPDLVDDIDSGEGQTNLKAILDDPRMVQEVIPDSNGVPFADIRTACIPCPTCEPSEQSTTPARRTVDTASRLHDEGASVMVQSICSQTFQNAVEHILAALGTAIAPSCVALPIERESSGLVPCEIAQTLPIGEHCRDSSAAGLEATPLRIENDGRETCRLRQLAVHVGDAGPAVDPGAGFYLDDFSAESRACGTEGRLVVFAGGAGLRTDVATHLDCIYDGKPPASRVDVGSSCIPTDVSACSIDHDALVEALDRYGIENRDMVARPRLLECEPATSTCQMTCVTDSDCPIGTRCNDGDGADGTRFFPRCTFPVCR